MTYKYLVGNLILVACLLFIGGKKLVAVEFVILDQDGALAGAASEDGTVIAGSNFNSSTNDVWRWSRDEGLTIFDTGSASVRGLSADGTIVGGSRDGIATRWDANGAPHSLGVPEFSEVRGVAASGDVMVGSGGPTGAFRWSSVDGLESLDPVSGFQRSFARVVSASGNLIGGASESSLGDSRRENEATVWIRENETYRTLGLGRPNGQDTYATAVSGDGATVVGVIGDTCFGCSRGPGMPEPFLWTERTGMTPLGLLNGMPATPISISGDASVIVGNVGAWGHDEAWNRNFVWDENHGMRDLQEVLRDEHGTDALSDWDFIRIRMSADARTLFGDVADCGGCTQDFDLGNTSQAFALFLDRPLHSSLQAGDADQDLDFDQLDLVRVQIAGKYLTGQDATWGEGDWNAAPRIVGDGVFDQNDVVAALQANTYLTGPYAATANQNLAGDGMNSLLYHATTGERGIDVLAGVDLTSFDIDSAASIVAGELAEGPGGSFDNDDNIFKAMVGNNAGSLSFGSVAQPGLSQQFSLGDLNVVGSLESGGDLSDVDLIYVPEPSTGDLIAFAMFLFLLAPNRKRRRKCQSNAIRFVSLCLLRCSGDLTADGTPMITPSRTL